MQTQLPVIHVVSESNSRIELTMPLEDSQDRALGISALIVQLGLIANQKGADRGLTPGRAAIGDDMQMTQFRVVAGEQLTSVSRLHISDGDSVQWRAQIYCHAQRARPQAANLMAEVTQRFKYVSVDAQAKVDAAPSPPADDPAAAETTASSVRKAEGVADRRRLQIFEGACEVISKKGWANASIRDITKAAKITIPTMYQYISSKEDILYLVTSMCMEEILQHFQERINDDKEPVESLTDAVLAYFQYIDKNRRYINLLYSETRSLSEENRERIFYLEKKFVRLWEAILIKGNESGAFDIKNTDLAANLVYFLCTSWSLRHWNIGKYPESEVREHILGMILHGISESKTG